MQSAKVCNNRVYLITLGLGPQAQWMTKYEELIRSFECQ
jgi:hypothetical protein